MRLLVARCEVLYTGRLTARLPEAVRLLMFKADGSFLVHDDAGGLQTSELDQVGFPTELLPNPGA
jgi:RecB family endonuclease NucS